MTEEEKKTQPTLSSRFAQGKLILQFSLQQKKIAGKAMKWLARAIGRFFRVIRIDLLQIHLRLGFEDPSLAGMLHGFYTGVMYSLDLQQYKHIQLDFEPLFNDESQLDFEGRIRIKTSLARLFLPFAAALFTFPYLSALILWLRIRKMKKKLSSN